MKKYIAPGLIGFVGLWFYGPIGAIAAVAIWWCVREITIMKS